MNTDTRFFASLSVSRASIGIAYCAATALALVGVILASTASAEAADAPASSCQRTAPEKTNDGWDTADLGSENVSSNLIGELFSRISDNTYTNIHSMLLVKNGKLVAEEYFSGRDSEGQYRVFTRDTLHDVFSATKSVNSILLGIAMDQHLIGGVDEKISRFLPAYCDLFKNRRKASLRLRDLLSMTAGLSWDEWSHPYTDALNDHTKMNASGDCVRYVLQRPMVAAPGAKFVYNSGLSITLGEILHQASGLKADQFAERYLFAPLGISHYDWYKYTNGIVQTGGGLSLRPRDMAKLGLLFLNGGRWQGKQIVSEGWVKASTKPQTGDAQPPLGFGGYGFQWWLHSFQVHGRTVESFAAEGLGGQFIFVFPDLQTVAVFTGWNKNTLSTQPLDMLYRYILPAVMPPSPDDRGPFATGHEPALQARFGERTQPLALPKVTAGAAISAAEVLRRGLEARGGAAAAANVRSFRAKGTIDLDNYLLAASPLEYVAKRPNQYREAIDLKTPDGRNLGRHGEGFDGQTGWNVEPGAALRVLDGKVLQQRREDAEFFAFYDEPARYPSAKVLGEVSFAGKRCYAVKLATRSGHEQMHYYDTATFLLAGIIETVETDAGPVLRQVSYDDYRAFGGFQFPTLIRLQIQSTSQVPPRCFSIAFSSLEVNGVEKSAVKMPSGPRSPVRKVNKSIPSPALDAVVGGYDLNGPVLTVTREGNRLFAQLTGQPMCEIFPQSETRFFWKAADVQVTFVKDSAGQVTKAFLHQNGQTLEAPKLP